MSDVLERPLAQRLLAGAKVLGTLWKKKVRCKEGWRIVWEDGHPDCPCVPQGNFCKAKLQWVMLAIEAGRDLSEGPFGLIETMTVSEVDALGIPVGAAIEGVGPFRIGIGGNAEAKYLAELAKDPESANHIFALMKAFPGSKMEFQKEPVKGEH
jgi:hypothetical protein